MRDSWCFYCIWLLTPYQALFGWRLYCLRSISLLKRHKNLFPCDRVYKLIPVKIFIGVKQFDSMVFAHFSFFGYSSKWTGRRNVRHQGCATHSILDLFFTGSCQIWSYLVLYEWITDISTNVWNLHYDHYMYTFSWLQWFHNLVVFYSQSSSFSCITLIYNLSLYQPTGGDYESFVIFLTQQVVIICVATRSGMIKLWIMS